MKSSSNDGVENSLIDDHDVAFINISSFTPWIHARPQKLVEP
jgi:hypothetical protein